MDLDQDIVVPQPPLRHVAKPQSSVLLVSIDDQAFTMFCFSSAFSRQEAQ